MDELQAKHRKEQRELQNTITSKKKNATKKTRKAVNDECETLQRELLTRQQAELKALDIDDVEANLENVRLQDAEPENEINEQTEMLKSDQTPNGPQNQREKFDSTQESKTKKPNRQKARLARRAAEQEAQATAAADEALNMPDLRAQEMKAMKVQMEKLGLVETFIQPDGHCLYSACAHGLSSQQVRESGPYNVPYQNVRFASGDFISKHPDDFAPFLEEPLDSFVKKIKDTSEWGGQLELQAIARSYDVNINILQAEGRIEKISSGRASPPDHKNQIWLAYYRHSFGLGEHYNALTKVDET